jgi:hypothetical protein
MYDIYTMHTNKYRIQFQRSCFKSLPTPISCRVLAGLRLLSYTLQLSFTGKTTSIFLKLMILNHLTVRYNWWQRTITQLSTKSCSNWFMFQTRQRILKFWWHAATLFIYFYIYRAYIQYFLYIILVECHSWSPHCFRSVEVLYWGAEPRFEPGPAIQQADALLS